MLKIRQTTQFKRDLKAAVRQHRDLSLLETVIDQLAAEKPLAREFRDHQLSGKFKRYRECHITPDWLLMYEIRKDVLVLALVRLGTHAELLDR